MEASRTKRKRDESNPGLTLLLSNVPSPLDWASKQRKLGLVDSNAYTRGIELLRGTQPTNATSGGEHTVLTISQVTQKCAIRAEKFGNDAQLLTCCAKFQALLVFSLCLVLLATGESPDVVDSIISWARADRARRNALLNGTRWVHEAIGELVRCGWSVSRATELFFLGSTSSCISSLNSQRLLFRQRRFLRLL